jgi:hypothetical protein
MYLSIRKLLTRIGIKHKDFSVAFSLFNVSKIKYFIVREEELIEMYKTLSNNSSCYTIVLYSLKRIRKT